MTKTTNLSPLKTQLPLVSIIIPTRNSSQFLERCLKAITKQSYKNIEIIVSDGKSTDNTRQIAKKYGAKVIINNHILAEPGITKGMNSAHGDLLMVMAVDNIYESKNAIKEIVKIFKDKSIFAVFPKHESDKKDNLFTKYINTFTDPFNHFIYGYASNPRTFSKIYKIIKHTPTYDVYDFKSNPLYPMIAIAQGFTMRKEFVKIRKNPFDDILPIQTLIDQNKKIAYAHSINLIHHTIRDLNHFIRKQRWATKNALEKKPYGIAGRLKTLTKSQRLKAKLYPLYSFSLILPVFFAVYHLIKDREKMWLFHPIITTISTIACTYEFLKIKFGFKTNPSRL